MSSIHVAGQLQAEAPLLRSQHGRVHPSDSSTAAAPSAKRAKVDKELDAAQPEQADNMEVDAPIRQQEQEQEQQQQQHAEDDRAAANYVVSLEPLIISPRVRGPVCTSKP